MNRKAKKAYDKAMDYYEKGKINEALEICEEVLSEGLDNSVVLNFKGLLLYQKGNLNEAVTVWKINRDLNNDMTAKKYIKDSIADEKRLEVYKQGEQALEQLKIDKALELFKICAESDFNAIKVNTGIAMCYQKKGDFCNAKNYADKVLGLDKNDITAKSIEKELKEGGGYLESKNSSRVFLIAMTILFVILAIVAGGYLVMSKAKDKNLFNNTEETKNNEIIEDKVIQTGSKEIESREKAELDSDTASKEIVNQEISKANFNREKLKILINNNDLDGVYEQLKNVKEELVGIEDIELYKQSVNLMKNQGVSKFYEYGLWYFNQGNYSSAKTELDKAYTYCEGNSLKEHIIFYRASTADKQEDNKNALTQYEEYYKQYPKGSYIQEVLYELALLSNSSNKEKSKDYANTLINNFPKSIYINDNLVNIARN